MNNFKQLLEAAADTFDNDDDLENLLIIVTKKADEDGKVEQHVLTDVGVPISIITRTMNEAIKGIVEEKARRLVGPKES